MHLCVCVYGSLHAQMREFETKRNFSLQNTQCRDAFPVLVSSICKICSNIRMHSYLYCIINSACMQYGKKSLSILLLSSSREQQFIIKLHTHDSYHSLFATFTET